MLTLRVVILLVLFIILSFIFWLPPIDLKSDFKPYENVSGPLPLPEKHAKLLEIEHGKAIMEIQKRKDEINLWFRYKFILIGSLLAGVFLHLNLGSTRSKDEAPRDRLRLIMKSPVTAFLLAVSIVISLSIDMHIRKNHIVVYQLGLWINYYVEPAFLLSWEDNDDKLNNKAKAKTNNIYNFYIDRSDQYKKMKGWEQYIRIRKKDKSGEDLSGMNVSRIYNLAHWIPVNSLTILLFILYIMIVQNVVTIKMDPQIEGITLTGLIFLHLNIFLFSIQSHTIPSTFEFIGFFSESLLVLLFPLLSILLAIINLTHLYLLKKFLSNE